MYSTHLTLKAISKFIEDVTLKLIVCFFSDKIRLEISYELLPLGQSPLSEGRQNNSDSAVDIERVPMPLKHFLYKKTPRKTSCQVILEFYATASEIPRLRESALSARFDIHIEKFFFFCFFFLFFFSIFSSCRHFEQWSQWFEQVW